MLFPLQAWRDASLMNRRKENIERVALLLKEGLQQYVAEHLDSKEISSFRIRVLPPSKRGARLFLYFETAESDYGALITVDHTGDNMYQASVVVEDGTRHVFSISVPNPKGGPAKIKSYIQNVGAFLLDEIDRKTEQSQPQEDPGNHVHKPDKDIP